MRLRESEKDIILAIAKKIFKNPKIYLFGSRADDTKKGGDIDLYIELSYKPSLKEEGIFLGELLRNLGEQKIDIIFNYPGKKESLIDKEAKKGILLE